MSKERDDLLPQPRRQHYLFAHRALPQLFFDRPEEILAILESDEGLEFVSDLWTLVGRECELDARLHLEEAFVEPLQLGTVAGVIIGLPSPQAMAEAFMVALISRSSEKGVEHHYFTLELGMTLEPDQRRTVLCAWTAEGSHLNMGDGPEPSTEAFASAIGSRWLH